MMPGTAEIRKGYMYGSGRPGPGNRHQRRDGGQIPDHRRTQRRALTAPTARWTARSSLPELEVHLSSRFVIAADLDKRAIPAGSYRYKPNQI